MDGWCPKTVDVREGEGLVVACAYLPFKMARAQIAKAKANLHRWSILKWSTIRVITFLLSVSWK